MNSRERVFAMLDGHSVDRLPVMPITMMFAARQAGKPYRQYVTDHRILAEGQLRTAERFGFDHVSAISDPAREAVDLGATVQFFEDQPPAFVEADALLADKARLAHLRIPDPLAGGRMTDRVLGIRLLRERAGDDRIVEGWIEGPCGEASGLRGINTLMTDFTDDPQFVSDLLAFVVEMETVFARAQIEAGADLIGMGDPASSLIGPRLYRKHIGPLHRELVNRIHAMGARVRLHICGSTRTILEDLAAVGADIVDVDAVVDIEEARARMGPGQVLLGGIDPVRVFVKGTPELVRQKAYKCEAGAGPRYILGAGCELPPETPPANVHALREYAARERSGIARQSTNVS